MAGLAKPIAEIAGRFVLVRLTRMRGVDLSVFDFDYDLTWMGFFLDREGRVLGRYGSRDATSSESRQSLAGLRYAMERALERFQAGEAGVRPSAKNAELIDTHAGAKRLAATACIHCHQVHEIRRETLQAEKKWTRERLWIYPWPENVGLTLEVDQGDRVTAVEPNSAAAQAGLRAGDRLVRVGTTSIASIADVQYGLHRGPMEGKLGVRWVREGREQEGVLRLKAGWRRTDISWRWSLRSLDPPPWVGGEDLSVAQKQALGLGPTRLAFEQGAFVSQPARQAGIRQGDIIVGINGKEMHLSQRQFAAYIRLEHAVGDRVVYNIVRDGKRLDIPLTLQGRR